MDKLITFAIVTLTAVVCLPIYRKLNPDAFPFYAVYIAFIELIAWYLLIYN